MGRGTEGGQEGVMAGRYREWNKGKESREVGESKRKTGRKNECIQKRIKNDEVKEEKALKGRRRERGKESKEENM